VGFAPISAGGYDVDNRRFSRLRNRLKMSQYEYQSEPFGCLPISLKDSNSGIPVRGRRLFYVSNGLWLVL